MVSDVCSFHASHLYKILEGMLLYQHEQVKTYSFGELRRESHTSGIDTLSTQSVRPLQSHLLRPSSPRYLRYPCTSLLDASLDRLRSLHLGPCLCLRSGRLFRSLLRHLRWLYRIYFPRVWGMQGLPVHDSMVHQTFHKFCVRIF